ncbi:MAG TPA: alpha/beta-type small acid-soluble spore protein [Bacillota bacterium]
MAEGQRRNQAVVPQARQALDQLKYEVASELGLPNYQGYLGDVPSRLNGAVGGNMVRRMIQLAEQQLAQQAPRQPQA